MSSAKVGSCEKQCHCMATYNLHLFNLIDGSIAIVLIVFGIYLIQLIGLDNITDVNSSWLVWSCLLLGALLFVNCTFSCCALTTRCCRCMAIPSGYVAIITGLFCLCLGIGGVIQKTMFFQYLDGLNLPESTSATIQTWFQIIIYGMFVMFALEVWRFKLSMGYREQALRIDGEYDAVSREEDKAYKERLIKNAATREDKYNDLRTYYKQKYGYGDAAGRGDNNA